MSTKHQLALVDAGLNIEQMKERAALLVKSGFLPKTVDTPEKAVAIMMLGAEYGIPPMKAFQSIDVIDGKPALSAQLQLALCQNTNELEDLKIEHEATLCRVTMKRKGRTAYVSVFGDKEATAMKAREWDKSTNTSRVISLIDKYNYKTMKSIMYEWRALARACRIVFPDAILGLHTPDELEDVITQAQEDRIEAKAEIADSAAAKKEELDARVNDTADAAQAVAAEMTLLDELGASYVQDARWAAFYPEKTFLEILGDVLPSGKKKGREFLERMMADSNSAADRANIAKFLELVDKSEGK